MKKHYQENLPVLTNFSNTLLAEGHFDEVIELLEGTLANIDNEAPANESIGACYYNLGLAYSNKADSQTAKKYYLCALKYLPNDQETILELIKVCLSINELENVENYVKSLQSKDIKLLLEMAVDQSSISTTKFQSINKNNIPKAIESLLLMAEYVAKFNERKFSDNDKITAFKSLCKKCNDNISLLSTAIYTKQYGSIREIVKKIPRENYSKINICGNLKLYLD